MVKVLWKYCKYNSQTQDLIIFGRAPNLLARMGRKFLQWEGPQEPIQQPNGRYWGPRNDHLPRLCVSREEPSNIGWIPLSPFRLFLSVLSCISPSPFFPKKEKSPLFLLVSFPFYSAPLVGSQWWCFIPSAMWSQPLFKIPD